MKNKENKETEKNRTVINNPSPKDVYYEKLKRIEETQAGFNPDYQESTKYDHKENLKNSFEDVKVEPLQGRRKQILERPLKEIKRTSLDIYKERLGHRFWLFAFGFVLFLAALSLSDELFFMSRILFGISSFFFLRMFFLEIGKNLRQQRRLRASRILLYPIFMGAQIVSICAYYIGDYYKIGENEILYILYHTEDAILASVLMIIVLVLWILAIILAILNKIMVNVHNQD